jgi:hypothetical protein
MESGGGERKSRAVAGDDLDFRFVEKLHRSKNAG